MSSSQVPPAQRLRPLRLIAGSMAAVALFIVLLLFPVLPHDGAPPLVAVIVLVVVGAVSAGLIQTIGFRTPSATTFGDKLGDASAEMELFSSLTFTRSALAELPMLLGVALGFTMQPSSWFTVILGSALTLLLAALAWPGERAVRRISAGLERDGGRSWLGTQLT